MIFILSIAKYLFGFLAAALGLCLSLTFTPRLRAVNPWLQRLDGKQIHILIIGIILIFMSYGAAFLLSQMQSRQSEESLSAIENYLIEITRNPLEPLNQSQKEKVAEDLDKLDKDDHYANGLRAFINKEYQLAEENFSKALNSSEDQTLRALHMRALAFSAEGKTKKAIEDYRKALNIAPDNVDILDALSELLFKDHEYVDAILILERLKMLTPENRLVLARLGMSYANTNNYAQAVTELTKALSIKQYVRVHSNHPIEFMDGSTVDSDGWYETNPNLSATEGVLLIPAALKVYLSADKEDDNFVILGNDPRAPVFGESLESIPLPKSDMIPKQAKDFSHVSSSERITTAVQEFSGKDLPVTRVYFEYFPYTTPFINLYYSVTLTRARSFFELKKYHEAAHDYLQLIKANPNNDKLSFRLIANLLNLGNLKDSRDILFSLLHRRDEKDTFLESLLDDIDTALRHYISCKDGLFSACRLTPHGRYLAGVANILSRKKEDGLRDIEMAVKLKEHFPKAWAEICYGKHQLGELENALEACKKSLSQAPDNEIVVRETASIAEKTGKWHEVVKLIDKAIETKPNNEAILGVGAIAHGRIADYAGAEKLFLKLFSIGGKNALNYLNLGIVYKLQHKFLKASKAFKTSTNIEPSNKEAQFELGLSSLKINELEQASNAFEECIRLDYSFHKARYYFAIVRLRLGDLTSAKIQYAFLEANNDAKVLADNLSEAISKAEHSGQ
ncbi:MAG TPA: tetratricopeptide repeat protein [candidate division Zixibacteria bacterium]|nr:tetratricopeptide repeat protein [candidate division Zixibacteria bacterium]